MESCRFPLRVSGLSSSGGSHSTLGGVLRSSTSTKEHLIKLHILADPRHGDDNERRVPKTTKTHTHTHTQSTQTQQTGRGGAQREEKERLHTDTGYTHTERERK